MSSDIKLNASVQELVDDEVFEARWVELSPSALFVFAPQPLPRPLLATVLLNRSTLLLSFLFDFFQLPKRRLSLSVDAALAPPLPRPFAPPSLPP